MTDQMIIRISRPTFSLLISGPGSNIQISTDPRLAEEEEDWYHRAISAICYGIVVHIDDAMAICVGNSFADKYGW